MTIAWQGPRQRLQPAGAPFNWSEQSQFRPAIWGVALVAAADAQDHEANTTTCAAGQVAPHHSCSVSVSAAEKMFICSEGSRETKVRVKAEHSGWFGWSARLRPARLTPASPIVP